MANMTEELKLKKAHIALMKHPRTALYSGVILYGESSVEEGVPTAYTDGKNKRYGREFFKPLSDKQARGLVLHENLHVALKHIIRFKKEFKEDAQCINAAADFAANDIIMQIHEAEPDFIELPEGGLWDKKYRDWSVREIYDDIRKQNKGRSKSGGGGQGSGQDGQGNESGQGEPLIINGKEYEGFDEHDFDGGKEISPEEMKKMSDAIDQALRQGGILAGKLGGKMPRSIEEMLEPVVDWRAELRDFVTSAAKGNDELTWRKFNKRLIAEDIYMPSLYSEQVGELVVAIDTSGSIGGHELAVFAGELASICEVCTPEKVRVLWWDTKVHGEQVFEGNYTNIAQMLKPLGGGGTHVSSVSEYLVDKKVNVDAVIIFTDGYLESHIRWEIQQPTLWLVTQNKNLQVPSGKIVKFDKD